MTLGSCLLRRNRDPSHNTSMRDAEMFDRLDGEVQFATPIKAITVVMIKASPIKIRFRLSFITRASKAVTLLVRLSFMVHLVFG